MDGGSPAAGGGLMLFPGCGCCQTCNEPECTACAEGCTWFDDEFETIADDYESVPVRRASGCAAGNFFREKIGTCIALVCAGETWPSADGSGALVREFTRPSGSGWKIKVEADCLSIVDDEDGVLTSTAGVVIGGAYAFFHRGRFIAYEIGHVFGYVRRCDDGSNCCEPEQTVQFFTPPDDDGEYLNRRLGLEIEDIGGGNFTVRMYDRGELVKELASVALSIPTPVSVGVASTDSAKWKNLCITLTNGS
jgi:hypothetical protein